MIKKLQNFKKIAALTIALFAVSFGLKAQTWYIMGEYIWSPPNPQGTFKEFHEQRESVVINGMDYNTIYNTTQGELLGAYRNDGNQVYYCKWNGGGYDEEVILYDYDLEEGDYFNDSDEHAMMVEDVTIITDANGVERKRFTFSFLGLEDETEYWIEGIGSNKGFVNSGNYTPTSNGAIFHLLCYHVDSDLIFVNPEYNTCDIDEIHENDAENQIIVFPNPASNTVNILNANQNAKVEIIDLLGRIVLSVENSDPINVSTLPEGYYFVRIQGETTVVRKLTVSNK